MMISFILFFFCKQKTAYEMRISDWSSDVCSSDLFSMSESEFLRFKEDFDGNDIVEKIDSLPPVELMLADGSPYPEKGKVELVSGQFDNSVGAITFRAVFPNTDRVLRSGNTGRIRIPIIREEARSEERRVGKE